LSRWNEDELRAFYQEEGREDYQARLYRQGDWIHQRLKEVVLRELAACVSPLAKVLDAGCAEGVYLREKRYLFSFGLGLDISSPKLARAQRFASGAPHVHFAVANLEALPCATALFDGALAIETLEHVPRFQQALAELSRVLKPGGWLIASVPTELDERGGLGKIGLDWREKSGHLHSFSRASFRHELEASGFSIRKQIVVDVLGGTTRYGIVSSWLWRAPRALWRRLRRGASGSAGSSRDNRIEPAIPSITAPSWRALDKLLAKIPYLNRRASLAVWVCLKP
jgi:SAM-dependent methyltransferase